MKVMLKEADADRLKSEMLWLVDVDKIFGVDQGATFLVQDPIFSNWKFIV